MPMILDTKRHKSQHCDVKVDVPTWVYPTPSVYKSEALVQIHKSLVFVPLVREKYTAIKEPRERDRRPRPTRRLSKCVVC